MNTEAIGHACILLFGIFISSVSQVLLKKSATKEYGSYVKEYLNPYVIISYSLLLGATLLSVIAYRGITLSLGLVLETTSYLYVTFFGVKIFKEKLTLKKVIAIGMIIVGIIVFTVFG